MPFVSGPLADVVVDVEGVHVYASQSGCESKSTYEINLCSSCRTCLHHHKLPPLALANHTLLGKVPSELKDLTIVEECMIALCRAKRWIIQLTENDTDLSFPQYQ